ncbi:DUF5655 domain-containing protein [Demequina muriae]|uniref:DUF5655 domain-containing protein n=1 Tax=Demequina muriae TaxID=3051664 RepID=A0ABT8GGX7_9MICO|nr:DUF5655 domain-containing protein [Demequina sp. EGI L300058]MDN4480609.1 DUF5655 domain-containing protein [Demequina sp. EGI L300058]
MGDPQAQASAQIANIEAATGRSVELFADEVAAAGLEKHGEIVAHFKASHGLTHGNANALAHAVRTHLAGGPAEPDALLTLQYAGAKAVLRPILDALVAQASALGDDVDVVVQKTGVSLRRAKQFALVQAPSATRVQLGLNLDATPPGERVTEASGMCTHRASLTAVDEVDDEVAGWLSAAYERAG